MTTDPLNLAAFTVFVFITAVGGAALSLTFWRALTTIHKEPAMHGNLSRTPAPRAVHIHNAREARHLNPRPSGITLDTDDALSFDFGAMESRALRVRAKVDTYAAQEVIAWREIIGDPEVMRAMVRHPNRHVAKRARLAVWKRDRALRGVK